MDVNFGYPEGLEDADERAVRGGQAILEAKSTLNLRLAGEHHLTLTVRVCCGP